MEREIEVPTHPRNMEVQAVAFETTETVDCDILIIGGGMSGCGAAFEAKYWAGDKRRGAGGEGGHRAQRRHRRGPLGHQLLHGPAIRVEHARGLRQLRGQRHDGPGPGRPGVRRGPPRGQLRPPAGGMGPAHLEAGKRPVRAHRAMADSHSRRVHQAHRRRACAHGAGAGKHLRAHRHHPPAHRRR